MAGSSALTSPLVELEDVHIVHKARSGGLLHRDRVFALTGTDLAIESGQTIGIVGESGCGKSTLATVLVGLQPPTRGTIRFQGQDIWRQPAQWRRKTIGSNVGMIFQDPATALNRRLPVHQIVRDPLDVHRRGSLSERNARVEELLVQVGLPSSVANLLPSQLSGGQRQRVAIARALALNPKLLVADEPTSALDVSVRAQILNLLLDLKQRLGLTLVYVSHDIQTVRRMSDQILAMYLGRIVERVPAAAIPHDARHPYTRALFSAAPGLLSPIDPIPLVGPVPSATKPPSGCPFRTRCWLADEQCSQQLPALRDDQQNPAAPHQFRCHHPLQVGATDRELIDQAQERP